jgi:hypothetical protein
MRTHANIHSAEIPAGERDDRNRSHRSYGHIRGVRRGDGETDSGARQREFLEVTHDTILPLVPDRECAATGSSFAEDNDATKFLNVT